MGELNRCGWAGTEGLMATYHDEEWGVPERDSRALWECLMLEGFQAGLSWSIILKRREAFRAAFDGFDPAKVAAYTEVDIERLLANAKIIRSRAKIEATILGAKIFLQEANFSDWVWSFVDGTPVRLGSQEVPAKTKLSERLSKELKAKGFKFVGPVIVYAWMQAVGLVDDHTPGCFKYQA